MLAGETIKEVQRQSPCFTCTVVKDPRNCENKLCKEWQAWFIERWEALRKYYRSAMGISTSRDKE